jgi:GAF domain-containing protein
MDKENKIEINTFKTVLRLISEFNDLDLLCLHLVQVLAAEFGVKACALFAQSPGILNSEIFASFGLSKNYSEKELANFFNGMDASLKKQAVIIPDIRNEKKFHHSKELRKEGIRAIVSIPIVFSGKLIAHLRLYHHDVWNVRMQDMEFLELIADRIGLTIAYLRLRNAMHSISDVITDTSSDFVPLS